MNRKLIILIVVAGVIILGGAWWYGNRAQEIKTPFADTRDPTATSIVKNANEKKIELSCVSETMKSTVRGDSMVGILNAGDQVKVLVGFYNCNEVKRGDVVVYKYAAEPDPVVKVARGIPGDVFSVERVNPDRVYIIVNGKKLENSEGKPYLVDNRAAAILNLYVKDYKGKIPEGAYLIMGNLTQGSTDSSKFGLVDKKDFLGKAVR